MRVLNLYAGIGGNRKLWGAGIDVVAVEHDPAIAAAYCELHPGDKVIIGDAHEYLRLHHSQFDFIWSSPPCQSHSRMVRWSRHKVEKFPDMKLYEEILFLSYFASCKWVVENVVPYYSPLIEPSSRIGRHLFWSNFEIEAEPVEPLADFTNRPKSEVMAWLGIEFDRNIYCDGNHDPVQVFRNCVHPKLGKQVFESAALLGPGGAS